MTLRPRPLAGIFVGGKSSRMGSPKGLLVGPQGIPLVNDLVNIARPLCDVVLVGNAEAYAQLCPDVRAIADAPGVEGPLAGLSALLREAGGRPAIALACDLPFAGSLVDRLALTATKADVLAPRASPDAPWEALFARYEPSSWPKVQAAIADGVRSFQNLFSRLQVEPIALSDDELPQLRDWDEPSDMN